MWSSPLSPSLLSPSSLLRLTILFLLPFLPTGQYSSSPGSGCVGRFFQTYGTYTFDAYAEPPGPSETDVYAYTATSTGVVDTLYVDLVASGSSTSFQVQLYDSSGTQLATTGDVELSNNTPQSFPVVGKLGHVVQGQTYYLHLITSVSRTLSSAHLTHFARAGGHGDLSCPAGRPCVLPAAANSLPAAMPPSPAVCRAR